MKKTLIIIFSLILLIFFSSEILLRSYLSIKHIKNPHISYWGKTWYRFDHLKFSKFDENLISVLTEASYKNVDIPRWKKNSNITINKNGFRENKNPITEYKNKKKFLVTGDSFAFGEQVSDNETWPSCLERKTKLKVNNGSHPGYSTGQSLRKALIESNKEKYDYFIWSIFFDDFRRDVNNKFIIKKNNELYFNKFKEIDKTKSQINKKKIYHYLKEFSFVTYIFDRKIMKKFNETQKQIKFEPVLGDRTNYTKEEQIKFLINEFLKIQIDKKYILLQYSDQSENSKKSTRDKHNRISKKYFKSLIDISLKNNIQILDTKTIFTNMSEKDKRLAWFDHHTGYGNLKVCDFIVEKLNF